MNSVLRLECKIYPCVYVISTYLGMVDVYVLMQERKVSPCFCIGEYVYSVWLCVVSMYHRKSIVVLCVVDDVS